MRGVTIIGGGLAGTECAWQLAERGVEVTLLEQKPRARTPAQNGDGLAELVCSNSMRGAALVNAVGLLKEEMRRAGSLVMAAAEVARVPAGGALAVDRDVFSAEVTRRVSTHPRIRVVAEIVERIPDARPCVIATGPLTGDALAADIARAIGTTHLAYYDAIAPIVASDSIDWSKVFKASRYDKGGDDAYVNCPMNKLEYEAFVEALLAAEKVVPHSFEDVRYFEGCLPVEIMADRGPQTLRFGPMKPVGLVNPMTGHRPWAVVQLRPEDQALTAYNMVGFQTRMKWAEQKRVFAMIPGLAELELVRYGTVHRNTFVCSPRALGADLALTAAPGVYLAGQIAGVEGYVESAAMGLVVGAMLAARERGDSPERPGPTTALGSLLGHLARETERFEPSNVVWSMFPACDDPRLRKRERNASLAKRALRDLEPWLDAIGAHEVRDRLPALARREVDVELAADEARA